MRKAWRTNWNGITSIVAAETRGKAISATLRAIDEANYDTRGVYLQILAVRAPQHDEWAAADETRRLWHEEDLPRDTPKVGAEIKR